MCFWMKAVWILSVVLVLSMPVIPALQKKQMDQAVDEIIKEKKQTVLSRVDQLLGDQNHPSFFLRLLVFLELAGSIWFSLWLLNMLELRVIEIAIELNLGVFVSFLVMLLTASIPVKLLNGVCLLVQKQLQLKRWETGLLTAFVLGIWMILHLLQLRRIDRVSRLV